MNWRRSDFIKYYQGRPPTGLAAWWVSWGDEQARDIEIVAVVLPLLYFVRDAGNGLGAERSGLEDRRGRRRCFGDTRIHPPLAVLSSEEVLPAVQASAPPVGPV